MRVRTALLLLFTLSLTLGFGVHPCGAMERMHPGEEQASPVPSAMPSCHAQAAPAPAREDASDADEGGHGCCGSEKGSCPHVCHATALPAVTPPFLAVQAVTALIVGHVESAFTVPARLIDHVPLV